MLLGILSLAAFLQLELFRVQKTFQWSVTRERGITMTNSELLQYCMAKIGAEQSVHSDWKATQIKVEDVLFAMVKEVEDRPAVSLKTSPELAELLRQQHSDVRPSRHLNKAHWSTVYLDGSLPNSQIYYLVDASYQLAVNTLPEDKRKLLVQP